MEMLISSQCMEEECTDEHGDLYYTGKCHLGGPVKVKYEQGADHIEIICVVCEKFVIAIAVAKEEHVERPDKSVG